MRKFIVCLVMLVMVWTVVDRYFDDHNWRMYHIIENKNNVRKVIESYHSFTNPLIVGDKVEIITDAWGREIIQRVK